MRFLGAAVAGVLALTAPIAADAGAATLASSAGPVNTGRAPAIVQVWVMVLVGIIRRPVIGVVAGTRTPVIPANGEEIGLARIGRRTVILAFGVRLRRGAAIHCMGRPLRSLPQLR